MTTWELHKKEMVRRKKFEQGALEGFGYLLMLMSIGIFLMMCH